jgi:hypothetical protein
MPQTRHHEPATQPQGLAAFLLGCWVIAKRLAIRGTVFTTVFALALLGGYLLGWGAWSVGLACVLTWLTTFWAR